MKIASRHVVTILDHINKSWGRKREEVKARHDLVQYEKYDRINDLTSELFQIKEDLFDRLTDTNVKNHSMGFVIISYNKEQVIIKVDTHGEYIVTPPNKKNNTYGYIEYKEMI